MPGADIGHGAAHAKSNPNAHEGGTESETNTMTNTNVTDPFADPSAGDFFNGEARKTVEGALLAFEVTEFIPNKPTAHSRPDEQTPVVVASVFVLDGEHKGKCWENSEIYGGLVTNLKRNVGEIVLGRLVKGKPNPKFPNNPPWSIQKATAEDRKIGMAWYTEHTKPAADPFAA